MSKKSFTISIVALLASPLLAHAQSVIAVIDRIIDIFRTLVPIFVGFAIVLFFWGVVKFIAHADDEHAVEEGKMYMVWGLVGIFVIISMWGIVGYIQATLGLNNPGMLIAPAVQITVPT